MREYLKQAWEDCPSIQRHSGSNDEEAVDMIRSGNGDQESVLLGQLASDCGIDCTWFYMRDRKGMDK